jgi:uncharacterized protein (TIGR01244 family)
MIAVTTLTPHYSIAGQLRSEHFAPIKSAGYGTVINFRPDGESDHDLQSMDAQRAAEAVGLRYIHVPASKYNLFAESLVSEAARAINSARGRVLAHCASGQRAAILWAAVNVRDGSVDAVLDTLRAAGHDFSFLRDDLEAVADRARWNPSPLEAA